MSIWTHVTGVIRVDGILCSGPLGEKYNVKALSEFIGESWTFDKLINYFKVNRLGPSPLIECKLPHGSEGSIDYHIHEYSTGMPWVVVTFWGDLRDHDSPEEVVEWAKNLLDRLEKECYYVRQFCFTVSCKDKILELNNSCYEINTDSSDT